MSVYQLRKELITKGHSIEKIPLLQDDKRTLHQWGQVWGNAHIKDINITDSPPGWMKDENGKNAPI